MLVIQVLPYYSLIWIMIFFNAEQNPFLIRMSAAHQLTIAQSCMAFISDIVNVYIERIGPISTK